MAEVKKLTIKDAIKKINKACKDWNILDSGNFSQNLKKLSLGTLGFDFPVKGGLPYGQIITFSGVEHSGKSTAAALAIAKYQEENPDKVCVYVDVENTLLTQAEYFQSISTISYEPEHFVRYDCTGRSAEEIFQDLIMLQECDEIGMIVIDSARALISQADLDNDFVKDNGQRASVAKPIGKFIKQMMMYLPKRNNILLIVNQVTVEKGMFSTTYTEPGGYALKFFPSVKVRFGTRTYTKEDKTDITQSKVDDAIDGIRLHFAIVKSRLNAINKDGGFITVRYNKGVDTVFDLLEVALKAKLIETPTNKCYVLTNLLTGEIYKDELTQEDLCFEASRGEDAYNALKNYLETHPKFVKEFSTMINTYISKIKTSVNLIDENIVNDLMSQEDALCGSEMTQAEALAADGVEDE